jgi:hypothetical protein
MAMENIIDDRKEKAHAPRIYIYKQSIDRLNEIADRRNINISSVYQEAIDLYLNLNANPGIISMVKLMANKI